MRIAVDVDDTLYPFCNLARDMWVEHALANGGDKRGAYCAWVEWRSPADVIDIDTWKEIIAMCHRPEVILLQEPYPYASKTLSELVEQGHELTYISDRSPGAGEPTQQWIEENFPTPEGTKFLFERMEVKSPFLADCQIMIDDRPKNLVDFIYDFSWKHKHGSANPDKRRLGFGLLAEHNRALTDIPGVSLAPNWKLLREYLIDKGVLEAPPAPYFVTGTGQALVNVHPHTADCDTHGCSIHNPSDHVMSEFPTYWRADRLLMERVCPHGVGHPDPDHINFVQRTQGKDAAYYEGIHGCDGCCAD